MPVATEPNRVVICQCDGTDDQLFHVSRHAPCFGSELSAKIFPPQLIRLLIDPAETDHPSGAVFLFARHRLIVCSRPSPKYDPMALFLHGVLTLDLKLDNQTLASRLDSSPFVANKGPHFSRKASNFLPSQSGIPGAL